MQAEQKPDVKFVYVTTGSLDEAEKIAEAVVMEKLAACANILSGARSVFEWKGKICREEEAILILKTVAGQADRLMERIRWLHSYECPCIVFLPVEAGNPGFLDWIERTVGERSERE